jgi:hypothetical protein
LLLGDTAEHGRISDTGPALMHPQFRITQNHRRTVSNY